MGLGPHVAMQLFIAVAIENAQIHPLRVQIDATIELMLLIVESHRRPPVLAQVEMTQPEHRERLAGVQGAAMSPLPADTMSAKSR